MMINPKNLNLIYHIPSLQSTSLLWIAIIKARIQYLILRDYHNNIMVILSNTKAVNGT